MKTVVTWATRCRVLRGQPTRTRFQARMLHLAWTSLLVVLFCTGWSSCWGESRQDGSSSKTERRIAMRSDRYWGTLLRHGRAEEYLILSFNNKEN